MMIHMAARRLVTETMFTTSGLRAPALGGSHVWWPIALTGLAHLTCSHAGDLGDEDRRP
jgi:hypothetical protein